MSRSLQLTLLGAAMCVLAGAFAVPALYVPGVTLVLVALASGVSVAVAARGSRVELEATADRVEEGEELTVRASVVGGLRSCRGWLQVIPGNTPSPLGWRARSAEHRVRPLRRGRVSVGPSTARWADPFQICVSERVSARRELLVLPRVQSVRPHDLDRILALPEEQPTLAEGLEFDGVRPHRPGSPASRIHWLTAARTGALMERRFCEGVGPRAVTLALDASSAAGPDALDKAVRATASLCAGLARAGGCSVLLPGASRTETLGPGLEGWARLHDLLALVEEDEAPRWELARDAGRLVLVQARSPQPPAGVGVSCSVSPIPAERTSVLFSVAGCAVQPVGQARAERAA